MPRFNIRSILLLVVIVTAGRAQTAAPAFDVASIKPSADCQGMRARMSLSPRNFALPCASLRLLIQLAYGDLLVGGGLGSRQMEVQGGPAWLDSERFDVFAKSEGGAGDPSAAPLLRTLLEDRFQLKVHKQAKESAVYILGIAKGGLKIEPSQKQCVAMDLTNMRPPEPPKPGEAVVQYCGSGGQQTRNGALIIADWYGVTMSELAGRMLAGQVDLPVVDQTGRTERFDIHLEFAREPSRQRTVMLNGVPAPDLQAAAADPTTPNLFAALEKQLGLKLAPGKAPLESIVVDRAERPSAN